jgi:sugar (pentulose or hexulose) kinase
MSENMLAIDNGTQSLRAIVYDLEGRLVAKARVAFTPYFSEHAGWAEQDPEVYWQALVEACQKLWEQGIDRSAIKGVCVTTQRGTVINLDDTGKVLRPAILWLDKRVEPNQKPVGGLWKWLFKAAGVSDTVAHLQANAESNWIRTHQQEIWRKTHKFAFLSGFLNYRLTGELVDSIGSQVGYMPFDYKKHDWASNFDWRWETLGIAREQLMDLVQPGVTMGHITAAAAEMTGIPTGLPVIAGAADKACEALGAGVMHADAGCISYGTTATITAVYPKYVESSPFIPPYPSAVPGYFNPEVQIFRGYWMVEWFKQQFGYREREKERMSGIAAEALLEELIQDIPPGSRGLMMQPYWTPGIRIPGPEARGAILGFTEEHGRGHVYRAILEGLAYALREGKERLERRGRQPMNRLYVAGGGSQSDTALQLTADIFGLPAIRPHVYETSALGAAMIASVGLGYHPSFVRAVDAMTHEGQVFEPQTQARALYQDLYQSVYLPMYERVKPLYQQLQRIYTDH